MRPVGRYRVELPRTEAEQRAAQEDRHNRVAVLVDQVQRFISRWEQIRARLMELYGDDWHGEGPEPRQARTFRRPGSRER